MDIDSLQIKISASATQANSEIDALIAKIQALSGALSGLGRNNVVGITDTTKALSKLAKMDVTKVASQLPLLTKELEKMIIAVNKMPAVNSNIFQFIKNLSNIPKSVNTVQRANNSLNNSFLGLNTGFKSVNLGITSLAAAFGRFYASYFFVIRFFKQFWKAINSTANYMEGYNFFSVAMKKIASKWDKDYIDTADENAETYVNEYKKKLEGTFSKLSGLTNNGDRIITVDTKNLGLNIAEVTQYASEIASIADSLGLVGDAATMLSDDFTKLAGDISSLFNLSYSDASSKLRSGLIGQSRALYSFGIDITNATLATYAYNLGIEKSVSEMTQAEKAQLRYIAIMDQSRVSWGDLANTINSPANMIRMFTNTIKECGIVFGQLFIPILQKVLPVLTAIAMAFKRLLVDIASFFGISIDLSTAANGYADISDVVEDTVDGLEDAVDAAKEFKNQLMGFDEINKLNDNSDSGGSGAKGMADTLNLLGEMQKLSDEYNKAWNEAFDKMKNNAAEMADTIYPKMKKVAKILWDLRYAFLAVVGAIVTIKTAVKIASGINTLITLFSSLSGVLAGEGGVAAALGVLAGPAGIVIAVIVGLIAVFTALYTKCSDFREFVNAQFSGLKETFLATWEEIKQAFIDAGNELKTLMEENEEFVVFMKILLEVVKDLMKRIVVDISTNLKAIWATAKAIIKFILDLVVDTIKYIVERISEHIRFMVNMFEDTVGFLKALFSGDFKSAFNYLGRIFDDMYQHVVNVFSSMGKFIFNILVDIGKNAWNWGGDMIDNFVNGIKSKFEVLKGTLNSLAEYISGLFHHSTPDFGPLSDDNKWFGDMMENFANGIDKKKGLVLRSAESLANGLNYTLNPSVSASAMPTGTFSDNATSNTTNTNAQPVIKVYVGDKELTNFVVKGINDMTLQNGETPLLI